MVRQAVAFGGTMLNDVRGFCCDSQFDLLLNVRYWSLSAEMHR